MTLLNKRINKIFDKVLEEYSILFSFAYVYYFPVINWNFFCAFLLHYQTRRGLSAWLEISNHLTAGCRLSKG